MSLDSIQDRYRPGYVIPDLGTIHYEPLLQAVKDIHRLLRLIDALERIEKAARVVSDENRIQVMDDWGELDAALNALDLARIELWGEDVTGITDEPWTSQIVNDPTFKECATCAAKPGAPTLCQGCLHNRRVIALLREKLDSAQRNGPTRPAPWYPQKDPLSHGFTNAYHPNDIAGGVDMDLCYRCGKPREEHQE